jgi:hypothetical protein
MSLVTIGDRRYRVTTVARNDAWVALAARADTGDPFGPEFVAATETDAVSALRRWLEWQCDHATALEALQEAERAYHRSVTSGAFARVEDQRASAERRTTALREVEATRLTLDLVRARRPE